jgi:hypothetical protein
MIILVGDERPPVSCRNKDETHSESPQAPLGGQRDISRRGFSQPAPHASGTRGSVTHTNTSYDMLFLTHRFHVNAGYLGGILRNFGTSPFLMNQDNGPLYTIAGTSMSVADIRGMKPETRTVAHWRVLVDWDLQSQRPYVIVDPYDPRGLLYLSRGEYLLQSRVSLANDLTLMVIARPGDLRPVPSSQNSPPRKEVPFSSTQYFRNRANRLAWKDFVRLRRFSVMNVKVKDGMVSVSPMNIERAVIVWTRQLFHYSGVTAPERRLSGLFILTRTLRIVLTNNGVEHLAKRLKVALFAVYSYLSGNPLKTTQDLGFRIRLRHGLPAMIPANYRKLIRDGNLMWIRIWVSILNIYRALKVRTPDPESAYKTIRKPLPGFMPNFEKFAYFARYVFPHLVKQQGEANGRPISPFSYSSDLGGIIRSAGTNLLGAPSLFSIILDAKAWFLAPQNHILTWFKFHGDETAVALLEQIARENHFPDCPDLRDRQADILPAPPFKDQAEKAKWTSERLDPLIDELEADGSLSGFILGAWRYAKEVGVRVTDLLTGRLFNFDAPGGKLRTVAICDYWTQIAMKPIHDHLFSILRGLGSNDATFDQQGTVDRYWERGFKPHWSFDLSAATDSIPITLYIHVLAPFFMEGDGDYDRAYERALLWSKVMTDREFGIPSPKKHELHHNGETQYRKIRYGTGQPMGAYSSWASMALVHHALVQYAHWMKGQFEPDNATWFDPYLVLGDDVDISKDVTVATNYQLACADFSIKIGLAKSLKSLSNFFEFANQRLCESGNISPLSFLEEVSSQTWNSRVEFASRIAKRFGLQMSPQVLLRLVTSARQWLALIPEFQGTRERILTRFLHFILLSPLSTYWHSEEPISVVSIQHWLQHLNKALLEPVVKTREESERIDQLLCKAMAAKIEKTLDRTTRDLAARPERAPHNMCAPGGMNPPMPPGILFNFEALSASFTPSVHVLGIHPSMLGHFKCSSKHSENFLTALKSFGTTPEATHLIRSFFNMFDTAVIRTPKLAPVSYTYLFACAYMHNAKVREMVVKYQERLRILQKEMKSRDVPAQLFKMLVGDKTSPLAALVQLYYETSAMPLVIRLDNGITSENLGVKPGVPAQDVAHELLSEVIPIIAQTTGVAIANLPVLPKGGQGIKPHRLRSLVNFYHEAKLYASQVRMSVFR